MKLNYHYKTLNPKPLSLQNSGKNLVVKIHTTLSQKCFNSQLGLLPKTSKVPFLTNILK
jgi:hypothetical protein